MGKYKRHAHGGYDTLRQNNRIAGNIQVQPVLLSKPLKASQSLSLPSMAMDKRA